MTGHVNHDPDCLVSAARVLLATLATEQPPAAPTPDAVPPEPPDDADDLAGWDDEWNAGMRQYWAKNGMRWEPDGVFEIADGAPTLDGAIIIPDDPREQARIQREIILDSGVDFAEHYAGLVDDPADDDAPTPDVSGEAGK